MHTALIAALIADTTALVHSDLLAAKRRAARLKKSEVPAVAVVCAAASVTSLTARVTKISEHDLIEAGNGLAALAQIDEAAAQRYRGWLGCYAAAMRGEHASTTGDTAAAYLDAIYLCRSLITTAANEAGIETGDLLERLNTAHDQICKSDD